MQYLKEYAKVQEDNGRIRYNTTVVKITRGDGGGPNINSSNSAERLIIKTSSNSIWIKPGSTRYTPPAHGAPEATLRGGRYSCKVVVVATGLSVPNIPSGIEGIELAQGYEDVPKDGSAYERQSVLVLGQGNAGLETGNAMAPYVNYVHVIPGTSL